jgi:uncharacterized protein
LAADVGSEEISTMFRRWRRVDYPGLEVLQLSDDADGFIGHSVIVDGGDKPFGARLDWRLDRNWRSRSLELRLVDADGERAVQIARAGDASWAVNGVRRLDLEGCAEVDVSATPFCNGLALRSLGQQPGELTALYVPLPELKLQPSRQRYERVGDNWRYVDLGAAKGFTAILEFDADLIVRRYEGLFEGMD